MKETKTKAEKIEVRIEKKLQNISDLKIEVRNLRNELKTLKTPSVNKINLAFSVLQKDYVEMVRVYGVESKEALKVFSEIEANQALLKIALIERANKKIERNDSIATASAPKKATPKKASSKEFKALQESEREALKTQIETLEAEATEAFDRSKDTNITDSQALEYLESYRKLVDLIFGIKKELEAL